MMEPMYILSLLDELFYRKTSDFFLKKKNLMLFRHFLTRWTEELNNRLQVIQDNEYQRWRPKSKLEEKEGIK